MRPSLAAFRGLPGLLALLGLAAATPPALAQSRGELLYTTHCIACHSTQVHWRDKRAARDWAGLKFQVRRWQDTAALGWRDSDIVDVARYLNDTFYRFDTAADPVTSGAPAAPTAAGGPWGLLRLPLAPHRGLAQESRPSFDSRTAQEPR